MGYQLRLGALEMTLNKPSKFSVFTVLLVIFVGLLACMLMAVTYFMFWEKPFLTYPQLPFVSPRIVSPGDAVNLEVLRCNSDDKVRTYIMSHTLIGLETQQRYVLPAQVVSTEPGCKRVVSGISVVPLGVSPGFYMIEGYSEVAGTIRTFSVHWYSEAFRVR